MAAPSDPSHVGSARDAFLRTGVLVDEFADGRRRRAQLDAAEIRTLASVAMVAATVVDAGVRSHARTRELSLRALVADLATSTGISELTVSRLLNEAVDLCVRFEPGVVALEAGAISRAHLAVIHTSGMLIDDADDRAVYLSAALERARQTTPGRLAPVLRILAERFSPRSLDERHADAVETRSVRVFDLADGMAELIVRMSSVLAHGIDDRLGAQARSVIAARTDEDADGDAGAHDGGDAGAEPADTRTMDQLRADILTDLLLTATPDRCIAGEGIDAIRATVQVTVPVLTMTGASSEPCLLAGYGPIDTETARALAGGAIGWERVMTSPLTGAVLSVDRYRPSAELQRFLRARDERCRFPGCRRAVWRCDVDHTEDAAWGGATASGNLAHLCRRHHVLKHNSAWTVRQEAAGVLIWTSPTGRDHTDRPEPVVRFVPDDMLLSKRKTVANRWMSAEMACLTPVGPGDPPPF